MQKALVSVALKTVLPALLTALGTAVAMGYSEGFKAFCGL